MAELKEDGPAQGRLPGGVPLAAVLAACVAAMEEKDRPQRGPRRMPAWKRAALLELTRSGPGGLTPTRP